MFYKIPKTILTFIKEKWHWVSFALVINILDSCINASILLSIGKFITLLGSETSAKANIFNTIFGNIEDANSMFQLFIILIFIKTTLTFLDYSLSHYIGESFLSYLRIRSVETVLYDNDIVKSKERIKRLKKNSSSEMNSIKDLFAKGLLECIADLSYLLIIGILILTINKQLIKIILIAIPAFAVSSILMGIISGKARIKLNNKRHTLFDFADTLEKEFITRLMLNKITKTIKDWSQKERQIKRASMQYGIKSGIREALTPLLFFLLIAIILFNISQKNLDTDSNTLSIILLLLYAQGPIRRTMRVPAIWKSGFHSLRKLNVEIIERKTQEINLIEFDVLNLVANSVKYTFTKGKIYHVKKCNNYQAFEYAIMGVQTLDDSYSFRFDDKPHKNVFNLRKTIGLVSRESVLTGKNISEILFVGKESTKQKAMFDYLDKYKSAFRLGYYNNEIDVTILSPIHYLFFQISRLVLNNRQVIILYEPFKKLINEEILVVKKYLEDIKHSRIIIIFDETNTVIKSEENNLFENL